MLRKGWENITTAAKCILVLQRETEGRGSHRSKKLREATLADNASRLITRIAKGRV